MNLLCNSLNNALIKKFLYIDIPFKFKYFQILNLLKKLNCIDNFHVFKNNIRVFLRYYNNKPIFFIKLINKNSHNVFISYKKISLLFNNNYNINFISTNKGIITNEECLWCNIGGGVLLSINFILKNI